MSLVPSLLRAIVQVDGEALVMHVGERPYVVAATGQIDLSTRGLTYGAVAGILAEMLPREIREALDEFGSAQYRLPISEELPGEYFTVVAARGGDDVWVEVRRKRIPDEDRVPLEFFAPEPPAPASQAPSSQAPVSAVAPQPTAPATPNAAVPPPVPARPIAAQSMQAAAAAAARPVTDDADSDLRLPEKSELWPEDEGQPAVQEPSAAPAAVAPVVVHSVSPFQVIERDPEPVLESPAEMITPADLLPDVSDDTEPAVVLPLTRTAIRSDAPPPLAGEALSGLDRLLRLAAARGASTLYLVSEAQPSMRVDGEIHNIDGAPVLGPNDVESLLLTLMPARNAEALRTGAATEWICELPDLGRVRCLSFRDYRGPGGVFRMMPMKVATAEQLGLARDVQSLALEREGLVLVAGPRSSGKRTLMAAFVDLINRKRHDHVITIEREINIVHERNASFISQREARGGLDDMLSVARAALREDPDVLVLHEVRSAALMNLALDAAASGQLVIGGFPAQTTGAAIDRIIDLYPPEARLQVQLALAQNLRGVVSQVLARKSGGGRLAAREVLLNTPAVASALAEGKTSQLPLAIEGGRKHGMVPLNDALVGFVQSGAVDVREAYRLSADRQGFLTLLNRQGFDTSFVERLA